MKIGIVSTANSECGISTYSVNLARHFKDQEIVIFGNYLNGFSDTGDYDGNIIRCWERNGQHRELLQAILESKPDVVHFQHEFGLFQDHASFKELLRSLKSNNIKTVITFHTVFREKLHNYKIQEYNNLVDKIIVHHMKAEEILGSSKSITIPHGSFVVSNKCEKGIARSSLRIPDDKIMLLCLGFITRTKSAKDAITATSLLHNTYPNILLVIAGYPVVHDRSYDNLKYCLECFDSIKLCNAFDYARIVPNFLDDNEMNLYASAADISIENYMQTEHSISGMSHFMMSYGLPIVSSKSNILSDLDETRSLKYEIGDVKGMTENLRRLIEDKSLCSELSNNCLKYTEEVCWENIAKRHLDLYRSLIA